VLDQAEYFYVMRWVVEQVCGGAAHAKRGRSRVEGIYGKMPAELEPEERVKAAQQALSEIAEWNLLNNKYLTQEAMRAYFVDWELALAGKAFALRPPGRWRFFVHRVNFHRRYAAGMNWKQKLVSLARVAGAPVVGYRRRHWPQEAFGWVASFINKAAE